MEKNIEKLLLNEFGPLFREPDFLLRVELRDVGNYYALLTAVAAGFSTNQAIAAQTGISERSLHYYVQQLSNLGYIGRRLPLTGGKPNPRQVRYTLQDPLLRFWFRFVFPNLSFIQQMGAQRAMSDRIRSNLDAYFGLCFERLCRQALPIIYSREGVNAAFEIGEYWDKHVQIDVVGLRDDHWTDIGECKWGTVRSHNKLLKDLEKKVRVYPNTRGATIGRRLFLRKKPTAKLTKTSGVAWYGLEDLYESNG